MEELKSQLRQYVADYPPNYGDSDCHAILDMLYYRYGECNRLDQYGRDAVEAIIRAEYNRCRCENTLCPATAYSGHISIKREEVIE